MVRFLFIWLGQVLAGCGSNLAAFCVGIWLYRETGSVTAFSLLQFFHTVPAILLAGVAGKVAERRNRRTTMLLADGLNTVVALGYLVLFRAGAAQPLFVYALGFASGCGSAFLWPAYRVWSNDLVSERDYARVGGILKLGEGIPFLLGPVLGGALMVQASLSVAFAIQLAGSVLSLAILSFCDPRSAAPRNTESAENSSSSPRSPVLAFLRSRPGLVGLAVLTPLVVFTEGWVVTLFQPFMLHYVDERALGSMLSLGGTGIVAGGIAMGVWGGPQRQIIGVLSAVVAQSSIVACLALVEPTFVLGTVAAFLYFAAIPFLSGSNHAIWQTSTPRELQGRMFAFRRAIEAAATPASMLSAGLLVDYLIDPLLRARGASWFLVTLVPSGPGRSIALLFLMVALSNLALVAVALLWRPVRTIDLPASRAREDARPRPEGLPSVETLASSQRSA